MVAGVSRYSDGAITPRTNVFAHKKMLESADPVVVLDLLADVKPMPQKKTQTISFRRPVTLDPVDTPLVEGITPDVTPFRYEGVEGTLEEYGQVLGITDEVQYTHEDPVLMDMSEQAGKNMARTFERLRWGVLRAGTNVFYANGNTRNAVTSELRLDDQRNVCMALQRQYAEPVTKIIRGSVQINTTPVEGGYVAFAHTDLGHDIRRMPGFTPVAQYGNIKPLHPRELGAVEDVRYILSPDLLPFANAGGSQAGYRNSSGSGAADVYPVLYVGMHAYGTVPLRGFESSEPVIIPVDKREKSDPLGQRGYVGWKSWFLCLRLNELWMARLEVLATNPGSGAAHDAYGDGG